MRSTRVLPLCALAVFLPLVVAAPSASPPAAAAAAPSTSSACPAGAVPPSPFTDVPEGAVDVDCLVWWGVTGGTTSTTYGTGTVNRGQMASFLARSVARAGGVLPDVPAREDSFGDDGGTAHEAATNSLAALGIVAGNGSGGFAPSAPVRRDQMASFLVRTAEHLLSRQLPSEPDAFPDDDGNVHEAAIDKVAAVGITAGTKGGTYEPDALVTRRQMASFLVRTLDVVVRDRLRLVRVQRLGVEQADLPPLVVAEGPTVRSVPDGGTLAVRPAARLYAPPVSQGGVLRLPERSPLPLGEEGPVHLVDVAHVTGDARVASPGNAAAVAAYFDHWFVQPAGIPAEWTGSVTRCSAGTTGQAFRSAQLDAVNAARRLVALPPVREDLGWSAKAQEAALVMAARNDLSHAPPSSWSCWTPNAAEAAGRSNLFLGVFGVDAVVGYLEDPGPGNQITGHRRWVLDRRSQRVGFGDVPGDTSVPANALWVIGDETVPLSDHPVTWPAAGHFPAELLGPTARWSVSAPDVDFGFATVTATVDGVAVTPLVEHGDARGYGGEGAVVFSVPGATPFRVVTVTVSAPRPSGGGFTHTWTSTLVR